MKARTALTIAGSDSGGGAGVLADVRTFDAHGVWGTCAITAVTAQNTVGVQAFDAVAPALVRQQIDSVVGDIGVDAAKTGMLANAGIVEVVASMAARLPNLVVDPVLLSKHGDALLDDGTVQKLRDELLPHATVLTPNLPEAARLLGTGAISSRDEMVDAARALAELGPRFVLLKGGHLGDPEASPDLVVEAGTGQIRWLEGHRIAGRHTHGTGCVLSAAITAELARGMAPADACLAAKRFVERAIAAGRPLGRGIGPVDPGWSRPQEL